VPERNDLRQFLFTVFVLLLASFLLWTLLARAIAVPAIAWVNLLLTHWFPDVVHALQVQGNQVVLVTEFGEEAGRAVPLAEAEYRLGFRINPQILSFSLPFFTALSFATRRENRLESWIWGVLVLYPLMALGLLSVCLKHLMAGLGNDFLEQPDVFVPSPNLIGILYQINVLLVPTVAPALLWLWQNRDTQLLRGLRAGLGGTGRTAATGDD
jgi:hypothetical protein